MKSDPIIFCFLAPELSRLILPVSGKYTQTLFPVIRNLIPLTGLGYIKSINCLFPLSLEKYFSLNVLCLPVDVTIVCSIIPEDCGNVDALSIFVNKSMGVIAMMAASTNSIIFSSFFYLCFFTPIFGQYFSTGHLLQRGLTGLHMVCPKATSKSLYLIHQLRGNFSLNCISVS